MNELEVKQQLRTWILDFVDDRPDDLKDDTAILENGILSSLDVVELILVIEYLLDDEVETEDLEPEAFRDVNSIYATFFSRGD